MLLENLNEMMFLKVLCTVHILDVNYRSLKRLGKGFLSVVEHVIVRIMSL